MIKRFLLGIPSELRGDVCDLASGLAKEEGLLIDMVTQDIFSIEPNATSSINYKEGFYKEIK